MHSLLVRPAVDADLDAITALYAWHVRNGTGTFELDPPDVAEMTSRRAAVLGNGWPWLVAERDGQVLGYAYANTFRPRAAYRWCVEDSIYLAPEATGQGVGSALLAELLARCEAAGARQVLALVGDSANVGSLGVHRRLGFEHCGTLRAAGWKLGRWLDVVMLQKSLGAGDTLPAPAQPAPARSAP